jgi:hypothetical protein
MVLIGEQQRPPGLDHLPLDVIARRAQVDMRMDAALEPVLDRADFQVHGFGVAAFLFPKPTVETTAMAPEIFDEPLVNI